MARTPAAVRRAVTRLYLWFSGALAAVSRALLRGHRRFSLAGAVKRNATWLIHEDASPCFLTGFEGEVLYANKAAVRVYGPAVAAAPVRLLARVLAQPDTVLGCLAARARENGTAREEMVTDSGRHCLRVHCAGASLLLWRVEKTAGGPVAGQADIWTTFDALPVPLLKLASNGEIRLSNRPASELLGVDDFSGKVLGDLMEGLGRPVSDWLKDTAAARGSVHSEFLRLRRDDREVFVHVTLNRAEYEGEMHLIAVLCDATEFKLLEAQFVQSQKMQAIGQLAGGVAHDFNNLLTAISGHCDLLLLRHRQGDTDYADLVQINQNASRAAALVGQLLAFSRKQALRSEVLDLRELLSDLTHLLDRLVGEKVVLSLCHDPVLWAIRADRRQLEQVFMNLVVNARDSMPEGGEIRIETRNLDLERPLVRDRAIVAAGRYVQVKVSDAGIGIEEDKLQKIFEPFYTTKRTGEGTGLGLSTAYGIIKQTGGFIFADSVPGVGTDFLLMLPAHPAEDKPAISDQHITRPGRMSEGVVLLVEDEAPVRAFASRALQLCGLTVFEAESAEQALELLADDQLRVDVFVTDVVMPGIDGPSWVRQALESRPDTKVVFMSGYARETFGEEQAKFPDSAFLPKPFSLSELSETVRRQLG